MDDIDVRPLPERIAETVAVIRERWEEGPDVAIILGTGLGGLTKRIDIEAVVAYEDLPGFAASTVETHTGRLLLGRLGGKPVVAMQGRFHRYEGYDLQVVTYPVRVMRALGARNVGGVQCERRDEPIVVAGRARPDRGPHQPAGREPSRRAELG
jgi:hypothetical protein